MSNKELDSLFRNKLGELERSPKADSWDKIQGQLNTEKSKGGWFFMRIAATLLLLITFGAVYWLNQDEVEDKPMVAEKTVKEEIEEIPTQSSDFTHSVEPDQNTDASVAITHDKVNDNQTDNKAEEGLIRKQENTKKKIKRSPKPNRYIQKQMEIIPDSFEENIAQVETQEVPEKLSEKQEVIEKIELNAQTDATPTTAIASSEQYASSTGSTLVFDIDDLDAPREVVKVESPSDRKRGLKRILELVKEVKNGEKGLSDLRESKNELLALRKSKNDNKR